MGHYTYCSDCERDYPPAECHEGAAQERIAQLERTLKHANDNLASVQSRCTELLIEVRVLRKRLDAALMRR